MDGWVAGWVGGWLEHIWGPANMHSKRWRCGACSEADELCNWLFPCCPSPTRSMPAGAACASGCPHIPILVTTMPAASPPPPNPTHPERKVCQVGQADGHIQQVEAAGKVCAAALLQELLQQAQTGRKWSGYTVCGMCVCMACARV